MSRGGTKKARAEQDAKRRKRERETRHEPRRDRAKQRKERRRVGRPRAMLLHLSGFLAPFTLSFALVQSGLPPRETGPYWLDSMIKSPNASYFEEPLGFVYMLLSVALALALFALIPVLLWRRLYRSDDVPERDWSSVDTSFTLMVITAIAWVFRAFAGFGDGMASVAVVLAILSVYVPVFSALLAIGMPVVPGSGRIGGVLPGFMRIKFSERYLLEGAGEDAG